MDVVLVKLWDWHEKRVISVDVPHVSADDLRSAIESDGVLLESECELWNAIEAHVKYGNMCINDQSHDRPAKYGITHRGMVTTEELLVPSHISSQHEIDSYRRLLNQIQVIVDSHIETESEKREISAQINTASSQLGSLRPSRAVLRLCLQSVLRIFEGVVSVSVVQQLRKAYPEWL